MTEVNFYKIGSKFNSFTDSFGNLAVECVKIIKDSNNFTLDTYGYQDFFYNKYMSYWNEIKEEALKQPCAIHNDVKRYLNFLEDELNRLIEVKRINFTHFLLAYLNVFRQCFYEKNISSSNAYGSLKFIKNLEEEYKNFGDNQDSGFYIDTSKTILIPFISPKGIYGINTFLYLHFNNICPIGISMKPYSVHEGLYKENPYQTSIHDLDHCTFTSNTNNILSKHNKEMYILLTSNQSMYSERDILIYLTLIFMLENEYTNASKRAVINMIKFKSKNVDNLSSVLSVNGAGFSFLYDTGNIDIFQKNNIFNPTIRESTEVGIKSDPYFYQALRNYWDSLISYNF